LTVVSFCKNSFIQGCIKLIKSDRHNIAKISISNKCCSFELSIHQRILKMYQNNEVK